LPNLKKALELFEQVAREAPENSPQARAAALGAARTLEARNEIDKAIKQYEKVATTWKGTPEATVAQRSVEALRHPGNVAFYKELYAFKPVETTLAPGSTGGLSVPAGHPPIDMTAPPPLPFAVPKAGTPGATTEIDPALLPPPPPAPKADTQDKPASALPDNVFAPGTEPPAPKPAAPAPATEPPKESGTPK
jgi:hypothetical protein